MEFSKYQKDIFEFIRDGKGSAVINAVAGAGKTTTIVEGANLLPREKTATFVSFNKAIATELGRRLPGHVSAQTLHSLAFRALIKYLDSGNRLKVDGRKTWGIIDENMTPDQSKLYGTGLRKLVGLAKAHGIVPRKYPGTALMLDTEQNWVDLLEKYDVEFEKRADPLQGIKYARKILLESIEMSQRVIDFDDQLYLPVIWQAPFFQFDFIFVDEVQDINAIQRAILKMSLKPGGRLIGVGDRNQAIYGFRGADTEAMDNIRDEFAAVEFPLSVSYRCPKAVIEQAKRFVPHIEAAESAADGVVRVVTKVSPATFEGLDTIICRNTAPLVEMAFRLLRNGKPCRVLGRDIGEGLVRLIDKMDASSIEDLEARLDAHLAREIPKLTAKGKEEQAARLEDRVECIRLFMGQLTETNRTVKYLIDWIDSLFGDDSHGVITLSTIHKAKGMEWDRVYFLDSHLIPSRWARQGWQQKQEQNIFYVGVTRAKAELFFIDSREWTDVDTTPKVEAAA